MTSRDVARFFRAVWAVYCPDPLDLDLFPFWYGDQYSSPFRCAVVWDRDKWAVLADENEEARALFWQLFHELAHVRFGHVTKNGRGRELLKSEAQGSGAFAVVRESVKASKATGAARAKEGTADAWARVEAWYWWPVLVGLGSDFTEAEAKAAVAKHRGS